MIPETGPPPYKSAHAAHRHEIYYIEEGNMVLQVCSLSLLVPLPANDPAAQGTGHPLQSVGCQLSQTLEAVLQRTWMAANEGAVWNGR
jgi:hypothetical protein